MSLVCWQKNVFRRFDVILFKASPFERRQRVSSFPCECVQQQQSFHLHCSLNPAPSHSERDEVRNALFRCGFALIPSPFSPSAFKTELLRRIPFFSLFSPVRVFCFYFLGAERATFFGLFALNFTTHFGPNLCWRSQPANRYIAAWNDAVVKSTWWLLHRSRARARLIKFLHHKSGTWAAQTFGNFLDRCSVHFPAEVHTFSSRCGLRLNLCVTTLIAQWWEKLLIPSEIHTAPAKKKYENKTDLYQKS
jgi:hypothetical protein